MNLKKAKAIRQALRARGIDPRQAEYITKPVLKQTSHMSRVRYWWKAGPEGKDYHLGERGDWIKATHAMQTRLSLTSGRFIYRNTKELTRVLQAA